MANNKTKSKTRVSTGNHANIFHDQVTGITVVKGEIVELTKAQFYNKKVQAAIAAGHLVLVPEVQKTVDKYTEDDIDKMYKKIKALYEQGTTVEKIAGSLTMEEAKLIAKANSVTVEKEDTVESIVRAVLEEE